MKVLTIHQPRPLEQLVHSVITSISTKRLQLSNEKSLQVEIADFMSCQGLTFLREHPLDPANIPDFIFLPEGLAIEVKIKGSARDIYGQCARYASFDQVKAILLITNRSMGFPKEINGKPAYYFKLGRAWL